MRNWGGEFGEGKRARLRIERVGGGRPLSFGPCAHRRWPTRAMSLSCRQPLAAARCRLSPPPVRSPLCPSPFSAATAIQPFVPLCFPWPSDPSVCLLFPPLSSVPPFIFRFRFPLLSSSCSPLRPSSFSAKLAFLAKSRCCCTRKGLEMPNLPKWHEQTVARACLAT